jgi:hypothetical protein
MGKKKLLFGMALLLAAPLLHAQLIDVDYFYEALAPHGEWIELAPYGWVWSPEGVDPDWKPYSQGWWVYTDYGWTFASDEPWAWAVYHYGRWLDTDDYGWVWVPGTEWGPAWVAWRYGDDYVGWAPLPPHIGWSASTGLLIGTFNFDIGLSWSAWIFVTPRWFSEVRVRFHYLRPARNREGMQRTKIVVHYSYVNRRIFNSGYPIRDAERHRGGKIEQRRVMETGRDYRGVRDKGRWPVFKPQVKDKRTVVPRNLPDKRPRETDAGMRKRQVAEKKQLNDLFDRRKREINNPDPAERPKREARPASPPPQQRNLAEEKKRIDELERKKRRELENKQKRERERLKKRPRR